MRIEGFLRSSRRKSGLIAIGLLPRRTKRYELSSWRGHRQYEPADCGSVDEEWLVGRIARFGAAEEMMPEPKTKLFQDPPLAHTGVSGRRSVLEGL